MTERALSTAFVNIKSDLARYEEIDLMCFFSVPELPEKYKPSKMVKMSTIDTTISSLLYESSFQQDIDGIEEEI